MRALSLFKRTKRPARTGRAGPRPRRPSRRWSRWLVRGVAAAALVAGVVGGGLALWRSGAVAAAGDAVHTASRDALRAAGLAVVRVELSGVRNAEVEEIRGALQIPAGALMTDVDPQAVRDRLLALGWVEEATVSRRLPDVVQVSVREREPFAVWQSDRKLAVIGRDGTVITTRGVERFPRLLLVVGEGADRHAAEIVDLLATQPDLHRRVRAAVRVGERRWNLRFDNGVDVRLPADGPAAALERLAALERDHGILDRKIAAIDLRLSDRLIVQLLEAAKESAKGRRGADGGGKDT